MIAGNRGFDVPSRLAFFKIGLYNVFTIHDNHWIYPYKISPLWQWKVWNISELLELLRKTCLFIYHGVYWVLVGSIVGENYFRSALRGLECSDEIREWSGHCSKLSAGGRPASDIVIDISYCPDPGGLLSNWIIYTSCNSDPGTLKFFKYQKLRKISHSKGVSEANSC